MRIRIYTEKVLYGSRPQPINNHIKYFAFCYFSSGSSQSCKSGLYVPGRGLRAGFEPKIDKSYGLNLGPNCGELMDSHLFLVLNTAILILLFSHHESSQKMKILHLSDEIALLFCIFSARKYTKYFAS